jgi:hypothetical protein
VLLTADDRTALMHPVRLYLTGRDPNAPRRARNPMSMRQVLDTVLAALQDPRSASPRR